MTFIFNGKRINVDTDVSCCWDASHSHTNCLPTYSISSLMDIPPDGALLYQIISFNVVNNFQMGIEIYIFLFRGAHRTRCHLCPGIKSSVVLPQSYYNLGAHTHYHFPVKARRLAHLDRPNNLYIIRADLAAAVAVQGRSSMEIITQS